MLIRVYSRVSKDTHFGKNTEPRYEGVSVRSSAGKLIAAAQSWAAAFPGVSIYLNAVGYGTATKIQQHLINLIDRNGASAVGRGALRAELLLLNRKYALFASMKRALLTMASYEYLSIPTRFSRKSASIRAYRRSSVLNEKRPLERSAILAFSETLISTRKLFLRRSFRTAGRIRFKAAGAR